MQRTTIPLLICAACFLNVVCPIGLSAAPTVNDISLRGLQIGGATTVIINGKDLLPNPVLVASFPIASQSVKPNAKPGQIELEVQVAAEAVPGIYHLRVATGKGISNPLVVGIDRLPQLPFMEAVETLPVALHGNLTGTKTLATRFKGKKGDRIVADVESQRLGAQLKPILRIKDHQGRQIAWSPTLPRIMGDARVELLLPADGEYTVEMHDLLFRGAAPGYFRLKVGELSFADLVLPLGIQAGTKASLTFASSNLPAATSTEMDATSVTYSTDLAAKVPSVPAYSGSQPRVIVSTHPEIVETAAGGMRQVLPAAPVAISGTLGQPKEEDQFAIPTKPGSRIRVEMVAQGVGSPLDAVLSVRNEAGNQLASNDDRPGNPDAGLELQVPENTNQLVVAVRDLLGRGGRDFVYRIEITDASAPDFTVTADVDRVNIPAEATQALRVQVKRTNYNGKIKLAFQGLPSHVQVSGDEIAEGAAVGLLTLSSAAGSPGGGLTSLIAQADEGTMPPVTSIVRTPESKTSERFPWLRNQLAVAVTEPALVRIAWSGPIESPMLLGEKLPVSVSLTRAEGQAGKVRLRLLTSQVMPRKKVKDKNKEVEVDDVERALRLDGDVTIAADVKQATANVIVPADLPAKPWSLVVAADVLAPDDTTVIASTTTTAVSKTPLVPFHVELAAANGLEAKAGLGDTGKLTGKLRRQNGFSKAVVLTLDGLPKEYAAPTATVAADKEDFEFSVSFAYGSKAAELKNVKLVAQYQPDPKNAELLVRAAPVDVGVIKVVPGEPPPPNPLLAVFEDDEKFVGYLSKGGGQVSLETQDKYSGAAAIKVTPDQRYNETVPNLNVKVRENPGPGEFRFLRFAWKKKGGAAICLQLNHDGAWGVGGSGKPGAKFRYHAGPGGECYGASLAIDDKLPGEFVVVTRDLFADFGEFTLTGLAFSPVDGEFALFDHLHLARTQADLDQLKPAK
jgi:hypothetical protein